MTRENQKIDGDLTVERDIITGGGLLSRGNSLFKKNVRIEGCLYVRNIKGPCLGLFSSIEHVRMIYPRASEGSIALIGKTLPAAVWVVQCGQWIPTGESGGEFSIDLHDYLSKEEAELHYVSRAEYTDLEARLRAVEQNCNCNGGGGTEFLESVTLLSPAGGAVVDENFIFQWQMHGLNANITYTLQVSTDANFDNIICEQSVVDQSAISSTGMPLEPGMTYYWRVKVTKEDYIGSMSNTHSLTMAGEAVTPQMYYGYISAELSDYSDITDAMIKASVEGGTVVQQDLQTLDKTAIGGLSAGDSLVVLLPLSSGYVATSDSGIGTKVPFITEVMGANGEITLDIEGVTYKVYGEFMLLSGTKYIYVD